MSPLFFENNKVQVMSWTSMYNEISNTILKQYSSARKLRMTMHRSLVVIASLFTLVASCAQANTSGPPTGAFGADDPLFQEPYVDVDEWRDDPVRHHYVHGGFKNTDLKFSYYFPVKSQYQGRFFQFVSANSITTETTALRGTGENNRIAFALQSGAYLVESNMGGRTDPRDPSINGFRGSAAAADYSRVMAQRLFGGGRPYGYLSGGSGGAYRTIAAMENTTVWDGAVPYVIPSGRSMPYVYTSRQRAMRVLWDKFPGIVDALDAGGSGDMYAGLNRDEREALEEVTRFGFPPRSWFAYKTLGPGPLGGNPGALVSPEYVTDFWTKPGYEGSDPDSFAARARIQFVTRVEGTIASGNAVQLGLRAAEPPISSAHKGAAANPVGVDFASKDTAEPAPLPAGVKLASMPANRNLAGAILKVRSGAANGQVMEIGTVSGNAIALSGSFGRTPEALKLISPGDEVEIDNSASLAAEVIQRYQVPTGDYPVWDVYRNENGEPLYPQQPLPESAALVGPTQNGIFKGKMIVVSTLMDEMATPWNTDWYRNRVAAQLGDQFEDNFRVWFVDNAMHTDSTSMKFPTRIVSYVGVLHQALRDLAAWVEDGVTPPVSTRYQLVDGQVIVPAVAAERGGVQPVLTVTANGKSRAVVKAGRRVEFSGAIEVPPGTGKIVRAEWDLDGSGTFPLPSEIQMSSSTEARVTAFHTFAKPGIYFPILRVYSQREGDAETEFGRIRNLGRVRVVVE